jgi:uncharacterized protein YkwD
MQLIISRFVRFSVALSVCFFFSFKNSNTMELSPQNWQTPSISKIETEIFRLINRHRAAVGLKPLQLSDIESSAALEHSGNMASGKISFGHAGFSERIKAIEGRLGSTSASAENVAYGHLNAKEVVDVWLQSTQHRKNMEGDYHFTGIGVAKGKDGNMYYTEIFTK